MAQTVNINMQILSAVRQMAIQAENPRSKYYRSDIKYNQ